MTTKAKRRGLDRIRDVPWALHPATLTRIAEWGRGASEIEASMVSPATAEHAAASSGPVAIIPVYGVIEHHSDWFMEMFGGCSIDGIREDLAAALGDPNVTTIVLDIDSPGGTVAGMTELANDVMAARGGAKQIVAIADSFAASAAYWLAAACDEIVASPSAQVGSIGVYAVHQDISRMLDEMGVTTTLVSAGPHKTEGNEFEPLSADARQALQDRVNASYNQFVGDVAAGRRVPVATVKADYGGGRVFTAKDAKALGMVDRVETIGAMMARLTKPAGPRRMAAAAAPLVELAGASVAGTVTSDQTTLIVSRTAAEACDYEFEDGQPCELDSGHAGDHEPPAATAGAPFADRLTALATEAEQLVGHATERARLRAKEGRPAFSTTTERSLRSIRGAIDTLLEPVDPDASPAPTVPVEPAPAAAVVQPPVAAPTPVRFQSRNDWLHFLETH